MALIPAGQYLPFYSSADSSNDPENKKKQVAVAAFRIDRHAVTQEEFLKFVESHPEWRKSKVRPIFADAHYLARWPGDLKLPLKSNRKSPVTQVSWFAAKAYCEAQDKELPTVDQWEYAARSGTKDEAKTRERILSWYARSGESVPGPVGSTGADKNGVSDLFGLIWEWTLDFNSAILTGESRENGTQDNNLFCGNGSRGASDATDYAAFMRYAFRNSLKASYTTASLGFRCIQDLEEPKP
jgi:formylglycine-generating enzyme required for sulfatase activity